MNANKAITLKQKPNVIYARQVKCFFILNNFLYIKIRLSNLQNSAKLVHFLLPFGFSKRSSLKLYKIMSPKLFLVQLDMQQMLSEHNLFKMYWWFWRIVFFLFKWILLVKWKVYLIVHWSVFFQPIKQIMCQMSLLVYLVLRNCIKLMLRMFQRPLFVSKWMLRKMFDLLLFRYTST